MNYSKIDGLEKQISKIVYGTATPLLFAAVEKDATTEMKEQAFALLDSVYEAGVNTFDCAAHYGEQIMGEWMQSRGNRKDCVIITKCAHPNSWRTRVTDYDILADAHDSLAKLQTDCIDMYMLHRDNTEVSVDGIVEVFNRLKAEGKIKVFGASNWTHERIEAANEYAYKHNLTPMQMSSPNFGIADQVADPWRCDAQIGDGCVTISGPENAAAREWYAANQMPVFAYSSLARGFFAGIFQSDERERALQMLDEPGRVGYYCDRNFEKLRRCEILAEKKGVTVAQIAMAWIYNQSFEVYALTSPVNKEQLAANIKAMELKLTADEVKWLALEA